MILTVMNEKGGTGKTTLAVHAAYYSAVRRREKTLLLDLDPQCQAAKSLGLRSFPPEILYAGELFPSLHDGESLRMRLLSGGRENLYLIPSRKDLGLVTPERFDPFRNNLQALNFPVVIVDTPPSPSWLTRAALEVTDAVLIPIALTYLAMDGSAELLHTIQNHFPRLRNRVFFLPTMYRHTRMATEILQRLQEHFGKQVLPYLPVSVRLDEAQSHGKTIWEYDPQSPIAEAFSRACQGLFRAVKGSLESS